ncbi:protein ANTAGONIST OF LIKE HETEROCHROMATIN PROTEIN 1-like [Dendronephthya gigantea]|uniref:protein ANTAGONIST OF LIKE HETEROCHROMATIN PROTEIN 1-like n=1 Tax=Dendronephthya gigantea TaxID=151771 RepID=UPI00106B50A2|nr:protein ANTAGONIST OF LIKE HETEROCHROMATIN PROTEIN 1-like [Dendronephthya gigantea]
MQPLLFDELLSKAKEHLTKKNTNMRNAISPNEKLCCTLRFLASGASYKDLSYSFRISVPAISAFVPETCRVIYNILEEQYLRPPGKCSDWRKLAVEFDEKWQFPHCVGAIDGKHIAIRAPPNAGSEYFNYKKHSSVILLGIVDANAKFTSFDIGAPGSMSDGGVFKHGFLKNICKSDMFPSPSKLGLRPTEIPYFLLGDEAFALDQNLMKPYPHRSANGDEKVFNYRLSRARRIVENAFGILSARFRVLLKTLELDVTNVIEVVRACIALHNFLITKKDAHYAPIGFMDREDENGQVLLGAWRDEVNATNDGNGHPSDRPSTSQARQIRDDLKDYFFEEGEVPFQWKMTE